MQEEIEKLMLLIKVNDYLSTIENNKKDFLQGLKELEEMILTLGVYPQRRK